MKQFFNWYGHHGLYGNFVYGKDFICHTNGIDNSGNIRIGDYVTICEDVKIFTHKHQYSHSRGLRRKTQKIQPINLIIEDDVFIGESAIIIGINRIGKGAIIGAGAVVTKDIPDWEIWAGNPAKKIGVRE